MRVGIVIPAHDAASWIGDAIGSALQQDPWRVVVIDDGSADETTAIARGFLPDARLALLRQDRAGVSAARNRGIAACEGADALLFLDADDWLAPDALCRLAPALQSAPDAVAACGPAAFIGPGARPERILRCPGGDILQQLLVRNLFANCGHVLVRAEAVQAAGGFRESLCYGEDWALLCRVATCGEFAPACGTDPILFVRRRPEGAYCRMAGDPASFRPVMRAIYADPALLARFGAARLARLHARAEAENDWVAGRALLTQARPGARVLLRRSLRRKPSLKRLALTAAAHLAPARLNR